MIFNVNDHYFSLIIINIQYPGSKFQNLCWSLYKLGSNNSEIVPMTRPLKHCPKNFWRPKNVDLKTAKTRMYIYIYIHMCAYIHTDIYYIHILFTYAYVRHTPKDMVYVYIYIYIYHCIILNMLDASPTWTLQAKYQRTKTPEQWTRVQISATRWELGQGWLLNSGVHS